MIPAPPPEGLPFAYAGGYAPQCGGIHALVRDAGGRVQARLAAAVPGSPTWLHLADGGRRLHALLEDGHELATFEVDAADGALTLLSRHATGGALPVHLAFDARVEGGPAWVAHYGDGSLRRAAIGADGALRAPEAVIAPRSGAGAAATENATEGEAAHAHMARFHPRWPLMLATDLGRDLLRAWRVGTGATDPVELEGLVLPAGSGPRHFVFHPRNDGHVYLLNEQANALDWVGLDESGHLTHRLRLSSLPAGFEGLSYASDLLMAADGRRLFALNRLHDAIAVFDLDEAGRPSWCGEVWAQGSYPRSATVSPDGRELWVCLQRSHQICVFELDGAALPRFDGRFIAMPGAACVVFR
ncbi:lactonase family protein [Roseateles chitinivorans]|uniref:lactonase family protein n=1 Tax=Roseateles chitinivorans TaxID=2917965 RepID=UPI003D67832A